jgi:hypothetical protein
MQSVTIQAGEHLYKGDNYKYLNQYLPEGTVKMLRGQPTFFAFRKEDAEQYGVVFRFITMANLNVLDLDNKTVLENLYNNSPEHIQTILVRNYGYRPGKEGIGMRDSSLEADRALSQHICDIGYDGYSLRNAQTDAGGKFHGELMVCNTDNIQFLEMVTDPRTIDVEKIRNKIREDESAWRLKEQREERRKSRRSFIPESPEPSPGPGPMFLDSPERGGLFGSSLFSDSPVGTPRRGGKSMKRKRKPRSRKSRRAHKKRLSLN